MPTAGRLFGAITFALLGFAIVAYTAPIFEEGKLPSYWLPLGVLAGLWTGWVVVGNQAGKGHGMSAGLTGAVALTFWIVFVVAFLTMIRKSMRNAYSGPVEAIVNVAQEMFDISLMLYSLEVIGIIVVGGAICGIITEFFARRMP